jgi:hypothetical protein
MLRETLCSSLAASCIGRCISYLEVARLEAEEVWRVDVQHQREQPLKVLGRHTCKGRAAAQHIGHEQHGSCANLFMDSA